MKKIYVAPINPNPILQISAHKWRNDTFGKYLAKKKLPKLILRSQYPLITMGSTLVSQPPEWGEYTCIQ